MPESMENLLYSQHSNQNMKQFGFRSSNNTVIVLQHSKFPKQHILPLRTKILIRINILIVILSRRIEVLETRLNRRENSCGKNALHLNIFRRISISETLAPRIGNSFLENENSFQQGMKQRVLLYIIFIANLMHRIAISETLATRIGNSFLKNENSFQQVMKQRVLLERIGKSYEQNCNFRNSCHKNPEFFFSRTKILFSRQRSRRFFWKECLIPDLVKRITISEFIR